MAWSAGRISGCPIKPVKIEDHGSNILQPVGSVKVQLSPLARRTRHPVVFGPQSLRSGETPRQAPTREQEPESQD